MLRTKKGFTLLELIVVLVVLAILALIAIPSYAAVMQKAAERAALVSAQSAARDANALAAISDHSAVSDADMATVFAELPAGTDAAFAAGAGDSAGADTFWGTSDDSFDATDGEATITITVTKGGQSGSATVDNAGGQAAAS